MTYGSRHILFIAICMLLLAIFTGCSSGGVFPEVNYEWAVQWGRSSAGGNAVMASDNGGDVYVAGHFFGTQDFDPGPGEDIHSSVPEFSENLFLSKFDPSGNFIWARTWEGKEKFWSAWPSGISMEPDGNVQIAGTFMHGEEVGPELDYPLGRGELFLLKYSLDGDLLGLTTWGGPGNERCNQMVSDGFGDRYILGSFEISVDLDPGPGIDMLTSDAGAGFFISKFNGDEYVGSELSNTSPGWFPRKLALGPDGSLLLAGVFNSASLDFDPSPGEDIHISAGGYDTFLTKFSSDGEYLWTKTFGFVSPQWASQVGVDASGNVIIAGAFSGPFSFDPGNAPALISKGYSDIFIGKLNSDGDHIWSMSIGGVGSESPGGLTLDAEGEIYLTGHLMEKIDFDPGPSKWILKSERDIYVAKYDTGGGLLWATQWDSDDWASSNEILVDDYKNVYILGSITRPYIVFYTSVPADMPDSELFLIKFPAVDLPD